MDKHLESSQTVVWAAQVLKMIREGIIIEWQISSIMNILHMLKEGNLDYHPSKDEKP